RKELFAFKNSVTPKQGEVVSFTVEVPTGPKKPTLAVSYCTNEDPREGALPLHPILLPWSSLQSSKTASGPRDIPELKGGDWARGRAIFFGDQALCSRCHKVRGDGGKI